MVEVTERFLSLLAVNNLPEFLSLRHKVKKTPTPAFFLLCPEFILEFILRQNELSSQPLFSPRVKTKQVLQFRVGFFSEIFDTKKCGNFKQ